MRSRLTVFILILVAIVFGLLFARQMYMSRDLPRAQFTPKKLRILTYSSFVSSQGPGGELIDIFKQKHGCDVDVVTTADAGLLLERMKLGESAAPFDVVIGLDQIQLAKARARFQWKALPSPEMEFQESAKIYGTDPFVPFDWAPLTFIYRVGETPPQTFDELLDPKFKSAFALEDPRASTPGLEFYEWVKRLKGAERGHFLEALHPNVQSISPSWSFAYGLFSKKQARFVFSYVTSLAYHWGVQKDRGFQAVSFKEGHPVQVEFAAVPASCYECDLAQALVQSLLTPSAQKKIMEKNFMLPVVAGPEVGTVFAELPRLKTLNVSTPESVDFHDWDQVFKR